MVHAADGGSSDVNCCVIELSMRLFFIILMEMKSPAKLKSHPHNRKDQKAHFDSSAIPIKIRHYEMEGYFPMNFPMNLVDKKAWKDKDPFFIYILL